MRLPTTRCGRPSRPCSTGPSTSKRVRSRASLSCDAMTTHSVLCVAAHHIVWDGLSTDVFARELGACYASALDGTLAGTVETQMSFLDVAASAGEGLNPVQAADLAWWKENLTPLPAGAVPADGACGSRAHAGRAIDDVEGPRAQTDGWDTRVLPCRAVQLLS